MDMSTILAIAVLLSCLKGSSLSNINVKWLKEVIAHQELFNPWIITADDNNKSWLITLAKELYTTHSTFGISDHLPYHSSRNIFMFVSTVTKIDFSAITDYDKVLVIIDSQEKAASLNAHQINQLIFYLDVFNDDQKWKLTERFIVNDVLIVNQLGAYMETSEGSFVYERNLAVEQTFVKRRSNFQGKIIIGLTALSAENTRLEPGYDTDEKYIPDLEWYEVTETFFKTGAVYNHLVEELQKQMNFSTKMHIRKDNGWAVKSILENGTSVWLGSAGDIVAHRAEIFFAPMSMKSDRFEVLDYGPTLSDSRFTVFVKNEPIEAVEWMLLLKTWSRDLWSAIVISALMFAVVFTILDQYLDQSGSIPITKGKVFFKIFSQKGSI